MDSANVPNRHGLPGERTGTASVSASSLAALGDAGENLSEEVAAGSTPVVGTCENCGKADDVREVEYDALVDGYGYVITELRCAGCRGHR